MYCSLVEEVYVVLKIAGTFLTPFVLVCTSASTVKWKIDIFIYLFYSRYTLTVHNRYNTYMQVVCCVDTPKCKVCRYLHYLHT